MLVGILAIVYLPDHSSTCRWFNSKMRTVALERVPLQTAAHRKEGQGWRAFSRLLTSPVIWCFALLNVCTNITSYGIGAFLPAIIAEMGYTSIAANLRASPVYFWQGAVTLLGAWLSDKCRGMTVGFVKRGGLLRCRKCGERVMESVPLVSDDRGRTSL